jgi:hypothetical protein
MWADAQDNPDWYSAMHKASETGLLSQEELDDARKTLSADHYAQEYECSFDAAIIGAYYAHQLRTAEAEGRVAHVPHDPAAETYVSFDLGRGRNMALWFAQWVGREIRVIDYLEGDEEAANEGLPWYARKLREKPYVYGALILPHDARAGSIVAGKGFEETMRGYNFDTRIVPRMNPRERIDIVLRFLPKCVFDERKTAKGREALYAYHEDYDERLSISRGPKHDWCLAAGTQILTANGWSPIESINVHNEVLTPHGPRRIIRAGIVRETSEWVTIKGIRCTPEHRFFTSRGLVEAADLSPRERFWTRGSWGLSILAFLCAKLCLGFKVAIISATQGACAIPAVPCSYTGWFMKLCMVTFRQGMKSIISTTIHTITAPITSPLSRGLGIAASTNQSLDISALAGFAVKNSGVTRSSAQGAAQSAGGQITQDSSGSAEPAYNLTVSVDECYFVRGSDGLAYLVSNSSHPADSFGHMAQAYDEPESVVPQENISFFGGEASWMG